MDKMEQKCFSCLKADDEVWLFDAINGREIVKVCKGCSLKKGIILLKKPSNSQLEQSEKPASVRERLSRMAGLPVEKKQVREEKEEPENPFHLIDHFNWYIQRVRRKRGLSQKQLAESIAEKEEVIKMIENAELPRGTESVIKKIEQFLAIRLRKSTEKEWRRMLDTKELRPQYTAEPSKEPTRILSLNREAVEKLTIADLKKLKEEREMLVSIEIAEREAKEKELEWKGLTKKQREKLKEQEEERKEAGEREKGEEDEIKEESLEELGKQKPL